MTSSIRVSESQEKNFNDFAASDNVHFSLEKFRSPTTYSRIRLSQELGNAYSNFEGLFSYNTSESLNLTIALYRRAAGKSQDQVVDKGTFNPRVDNWWVRGQANYFTSQMDATLFVLYTTAFSGLNGGIAIQDSTTDIFDDKLAQVLTPNSYDHRTRVDIMGEFSLSLLSEKERTKLGGFYTKASRRVVASDSAFAQKYAPLSLGDRAGLSLSQPVALEIGSFVTKALVRGDFQLLHKDNGCACTGIKETRFSGFASDSLFIGGDFGLSADGYQGRRLELKKGMTAIRAYEFEIGRALLAALQAVPGLTLFGLTDERRLDDRVATFSFRLKDMHPRLVAEKLAENGIYVWDGNYYAINVTERLGLEDNGGMVRVGAAHYNTLEEVQRLKEALIKISG